MGDSGKPKTALNIQESKKLIWKNDSTYHQKDCTNQNAAVYDSLHDAVGIVFSFEDCDVPAVVQKNVNAPQNKKPHAQDLVNNIGRKEKVSAHQDYWNQSHHNVNRKPDFI